MKPLILIIAVVFAGCDIFRGDSEDGTRDIHTEILMHQQNFKEEASARGLTLDEKVDSVQIEVVGEITIDESVVCGYSSWYDEQHSDSLELTISGTIPCWSNRADQDNEALVFHHLGHLVLQRGHSARVFPSGKLPSIMVIKSKPKLYSGLLVNRRPYYISELFNPDTPTPDWGR